MHRGSDYQAGVAAWLAVEMLAEGQGGPISPGGRITFLRGETQESMDDLLVGTASDRYGFIQTKSKVVFSDKPDGEFASVIDQAVRQVADRDDAGITRPWSRTLSPSTDRLLLVTGPRSGSKINDLLRDVLNRAKDLAPGQPLSDSAVTEGQSEVLDTTAKLIRARWLATTGRAVTELEVLSVLALLSVETIDVDSGQQGEREAIRTLRTVVIEDPNQEGAAWSSVLKACKNMVKDRSGLDIVSLRRKLLDDGIALRSVPSYRKDIERLQAHTDSALRNLRDLSQIILDGASVHIDRTAVRQLESVADQNSHLVTGHPGAGKSGALYDLAILLKGKGDVVCLAADRLDVASLPGLRSELGLEHEVADVFANWQSAGPGYLLIDALDAARGTRAADALLALMREVIQTESRWHVIACIRKFDLRYSIDLQDLFRYYGRSEVASGFVDSDFPFIRHLNVPLLSEEELGQLQEKAPALFELYAAGSPELRLLLHVPFNLRLAATLLDTGMLREDFAPVQTQIDLLERYWNRRVIDSAGGDDREAVLRKVLSEMVSKRRLQVDREAASVSGLTQALDQLLSRHVLTEWRPSLSEAPDRRSLAFEHNFLFDFALTKLLLPSGNDDLVQMLENDPDSVIVLRPSLALRAQALWAKKREQFWDMAMEFCGASKLSLLAQMIPMVTVAENARQIDSLQPLIDAVDSVSPVEAQAGRKALRHLVGVLKSGRQENRPVAGTDPGPWCNLIERITRVPKPELAGICQSLIEDILQFRAQLTAEQLALLGLAARRVFDLAWQAPRRNGQMIIHAVRTVCSTFFTDRAESALRIRRLIVPDRVREFGWEELHWLAHEIKTLIPQDPELVADIYIAAFEWTETDESATPLSHSAIVPMISNKRQDFKQTRWHLSQHFPKFVERSPFSAARAALGIVSAYSRDRSIESRIFGNALREQMRGKKDVLPELIEDWLDGDLDDDSHEAEEDLYAFDVDGIEARLKEDRSGAWDSGVTSHDEAVQILGTLFHRLDTLASDDESRAEAIELIRFTIQRNEQTAVWSKLLALLAKYPLLALRFKALATAKPLMLSSDTSKQFGQFLSTLYPQLSAKERTNLERDILAIAKEGDANELRARKYRRDELLRALGDAGLTTKAAQKRLASLKAADAAPSQVEPGFRGFGQFSPDDIYRRQLEGETEEEWTIRKRIEPTTGVVEQFGVRFINGAPSIQETEEILPKMEELIALVDSPEEATLPGRLRDSVIGGLAGACAQIAKIEMLDCETDLGKLVKKVLLLAASNRYPESNPEELKQFDKGPGGSFPVPRIVAAEGLLALAAGSGCTDPAIIQTLDTLLKDPSAKVRYPIAHYAIRLHKTFPDKMWVWLEALSEDESITVREACLHSLDQLARLDASRALGVIDRILENVPEDREEGRRLTTAAVHILTTWYVWQNKSAAKTSVDKITSNIVKRAKQASSMPFVLRDPLTHGAMDDTGEPAAIRARAVNLLKTLSKESSTAARSLVESSASGPDSSIQDVIHLTEVIAGEVYFAAGVHQPERESLPAIITRPEQTRFYREANSVFDDLSAIGAPSLAHRLVETLEMYIDTDPRAVFLRVAATVRAGKLWNYEYEELAQTVVLRIVRRYLADKRALLQENEQCQRALREILETFMEAGWPAAQQLAYRIDEIHR
jgi:hypothetical protein